MTSCASAPLPAASFVRPPFTMLSAARDRELGPEQGNPYRDGSLAHASGLWPAGGSETQQCQYAGPMLAGSHLKNEWQVYLSTKEKKMPSDVWISLHV